MRPIAADASNREHIAHRIWSKNDPSSILETACTAVKEAVLDTQVTSKEPRSPILDTFRMLEELGDHPLECPVRDVLDRVGDKWSSDLLP